MTQDIFRLVLTDEAQNFIESLSEAVSYKIYYNIKRVVGGERNKELFKKLENSEIWEFRTLYNKTAYRLFAFWDKDKETLVIATHGIIKKTQKTPSKEIAKAEAMKDNEIEIAVQINGKTKGTVLIATDESKDSAIAKGKEAIADKLTGNIIKEIYVPGKIINIVMK